MILKLGILPKTTKPPFCKPFLRCRIDLLIIIFRKILFVLQFFYLELTCSPKSLPWVPDSPYKIIESLVFYFIYSESGTQATKSYSYLENVVSDHIFEFSMTPISNVKSY